MTDKELRVLSWTFLLFGWAFELAGSVPIGLIFLFSALGLFIWRIIQIILENGGGGGPLKPA